MGDVHHFDGRVGDLELLARVGAGDAWSANELVARHLDAVRALGVEESVAAGRDVLHRVKSGERLPVPFRVAWLAELAGGPAGDGPVWAAFLALPADAQVAVWHHEVEGEHPQVVGMHLGLGRREVDAVLAAAYDALGARPGEAVRAVLASAVLGERSKDYLARRRPEPLEDEGGPTSVGRVPALVMVAAGVGVAAVAVSALVAGVSVTTDRDGPLAAAQVVAPGRVIEAEVRRPVQSREPVAAVRPAVASAPPSAGTPPVGVPHVEVQEVNVPEPTEPPATPVERPGPPVEETRLLDVDLGTGTIAVDPGLPMGPVVIELPVVLGLETGLRPSSTTGGE